MPVTCAHALAGGAGGAETELDTARPSGAVVFGRGWAALGAVQRGGAGAPDQINPAHVPPRVSQQRMLASTQHQAADDAALQGGERDAIQPPQGARCAPCGGSSHVAPRQGQERVSWR
ncbi:MAG TPA: hypothetical protein VGS80_27480 [Ktedonobacterales bacterium]|nr:hypothetical protein [Ktedonobacterales bacterium]